MSFQVPYYNTTHLTPAILSQDTASGADAGQINWQDLLKSNIPPCAVLCYPNSPPSATNVQRFETYRAAADDFSFHYILGVPPLVNLT